MDAGDNTLAVSGVHIVLADRTRQSSDGPALRLDDLPQALDFVAINRATRQHHFETVVVLGIVAAGDLYARAGLGIGCKIKHGRGDHAHVHNSYTSAGQAAYQCRAERSAAEPAVTTHRNRRFTFF